MWDKFMEGAGKAITVTISVLLLLVLVLGPIIAFTPFGRGLWDSLQHETRKVSDAASYQTRKQVEDTCRATIVSYESDMLTWEQYKDSESAEQRSWADAAKIRANKAALTYNEYFLKNSYVFEGNVPPDIRAELPLLED